MFLMFSVFALLVGCIENIEVNPREGRRVVVNCVLKMDTIQTLTLCYSGKQGDTYYLGDEYYDEVTDAEVLLYLERDSVSTLVGKFKKGGFSKWSLRYTPVREAKYRLVVNIPGEETVWGVTTFPKLLKIKRLKSSDTETQSAFYCHENTGPFWTMAFSREYDTVMLNHPVITSDLRLRDVVASDYPSIDDFNKERTSESYIINKAYYRYMRMLPNKASCQFVVEPSVPGMVVFRAVSSDYDKYLKTSIAKMLNYSSMDNPVQWLDESEIHSNINNGVGIFGAYSDQLFNINRSSLIE